mmetsp:Transcript_6886/g.21725  ORF Transcript_6886/g.21725 Transcript_6886/m.21725 type:complete len:189 (+) Transcript_6886:147-713(+)
MAKDFGELALVLGDAHIPQRAGVIPAKFQRMLVPNKMQHVICTGNMASRDQYDELRSLAPSAHFVSGDFDEGSPFPETKVVTIGNFRIGVVHGHQVVPWGDAQALATFRRRLDVDVLISGHTHQNDVREVDGAWYLNPGSITGAYSALKADVVPSFILLAIQGSKVVTYVYELHGDTVEVSKSEFSKA